MYFCFLIWLEAIYFKESMSPLKIHGPIRIRSMQTGITKWKEGSFEIVEKENKVSLVVHYNTGGIPRIFQVFTIF